MNELLIKDRLAICDKCPLYNKGKCNSNLWLKPETNEVSTYARIGYVRGCNCIMRIKVKNPYNHCVAGKW